MQENMKFNKRLTAFLEQLETVKWFSKCGTLILRDDVTVVKTLAEVKRLCKTMKWDNFQNAVNNRHNELLWTLGLREKDINEKGIEVQEAINYVFSHIDFGVFKEDKDIKWRLELDIGLILGELTVEDLVKPLLGVPLLWPWYQRGHLPCGWDGKMISHVWAGNGPEDLPEGRLRVY
jgi:hypothetical protein